jgi:hypothetical protein
MRRTSASASLTGALAVGLCLVACGPSTPPPATAEAPAEAAGPASAATPAAEATASAAPQAHPPVVEAPPLPPVDLVQMEPSAAPGHLPSLGITAPAKGSLVPAAKAALAPVKLRAAGWKLEGGGNHLCVAVDQQPCRRVTDLARPLTLGDLGPALDEGQHVLTVIARRGSGESVKPAGKSAAFAAVSFFVGKRTPLVWKEGAPIVILSLPEEGPAAESAVIDAYVANADFGTGKYRLHATIRGPGLEAGKGESVADLKPWRLQNARPGKYVVGLELFKYEAARMKSEAAVEVTLESRAVGGPFAEVMRSFRVTK